MTTTNGVPATHSGRPAQHSGSADCPYCGNAYLKTRIPEHVRADHPDKWETFDRLVEWADVPMADVIEQVRELDSQREGFHAWWVAQVDDAAPTIQRKAAEYGSNSLAEMGRMFARAQGRDRIEDAEALEIGCMIYAKGKLERVLDAMLKGRLPSTDTWHDLGVYATMAQYIRQHNRWP